MQRLGALLIRGLLAATVVSAVAYAEPAALVVRGAHERDVRADLERTLATLAIEPPGNIDVELEALTPHAVRYRIEVTRPQGTFRRTGVVAPDALRTRVTSTVLLGLLARRPERVRPRVALVVTGDRKPPSSAVATWRQTLQERGVLVVPDAEVSLARAAVKAGGDREAALAKILGVPVVAVELRGRGREVAVQTTVLDDGEVRGSLAVVTADSLAEQVALMLETDPLWARRAP